MLRQWRQCLEVQPAVENERTENPQRVGSQIHRDRITGFSGQLARLELVRVHATSAALPNDTQRILITLFMEVVGDLPESFT